MISNIVSLPAYLLLDSTPRQASGDQQHVVLMNLVMPEVDGAMATRSIRDCCPQGQVITLTSFREQELVQAALEAGAISLSFHHLPG